jgi:hypothetical protein
MTLTMRSSRYTAKHGAQDSRPMPLARCMEAVAQTPREAVRPFVDPMERRVVAGAVRASM